MPININQGIKNLSNAPLEVGIRKFSGGQYVDWVSQAEVLANNQAAFIPNKFWKIAGDLYYTDDSTNFQLIGGVSTEFMTTNEFFDTI